MADELGVAAIEFAMVTTVLLIILMGLLDYGIAVINKMELESSTRSGAQYALLDSSSTAVIVSTVENSLTLPEADTSVTVTEFCECSDGIAISCDDTCGTGNVRHFMTITASYNYTPFFLPGPFVISGESVIRTQ
jgi:hypothetical protein